MTVVGVGKIAVLGINLKHWRSMFVYRLILPLSLLQRIVVSAKFIQIIRRFLFQYRRLTPNYLVRFPRVELGLRWRCRGDTVEMVREAEMVRERETEMVRKRENGDGEGEGDVDGDT
jgi:hypothetical protein